jgi:acyl-CoA reductase-like NAD-dependent aldehyde dehydrogenase
MSAKVQTTISPYTQQPILTRPLLSDTELDNVVANAVKASKAWKKTTVDERIAIAEKWLVGVTLNQTMCGS